MLRTISDIFEHEAAAIQSIPISSAYEAAINLIYQRVHKRGGKLVTSGMGKAGQICHTISTTFCSTGTPAAFLHPSEAQHGDLGILQRNDIILLISNSGRTRELLELIELARILHDDLPIILITGHENSPLASLANVSILTGNPKEVCPLGLTPTTSTSAMAAIGDALVILMMNMITFDASDYAKRHHGGYLGRKAKEEADRLHHPYGSTDDVL